MPQNRSSVFVALAGIAGALLIAACVRYSLSAETPADKLVKSFEQSEPPINLKHERTILEMDRKAITKAYEDQIHLLFQNWMKDATDASQPGRALKGARNARDAYIKSMDGIDRREQRIPQEERK